MYCRNCGSELSPGVVFCPNCGQKVTDASAGQQQNANAAGAQMNTGGNVYEEGAAYQYGNANGYQPQDPNGYPYQNQYQYQEPEKPATDGFAIASLVLGIISFFFFPIIGAILAIVFGNKSIRENGMNTMAKVGKILGIISLVLYIIIVIIVVIVTIAGIGMMGMMY